MSDEKALLVVGAGTLGGRVGAGWRARYPDAEVVAETRSPTRHSELAAAGLHPRLRGDAGDESFPYLLCAITPSAQPEEYVAEVERAVRLWRGDGMLLLTSSTAVYAESAGSRCVEDSPLADNPRAARLLAAEQSILAAGGAVVRLAGLYDHHRGPQHVFLRKPESPRRPDGLLNLIHYDDAATLCQLALEGGGGGAVYLGCDDEPLTRAGLVALAGGEGRVSFTATEGPIGRRCDNRATRAALGFSPRYPSFRAWVASQPR